MKRHLVITALLLAGLTAMGCTNVYKARTGNGPGRSTVYVDPNTPGPVQGRGIESQDIASMTDKMVRDMLANSTLAGRSTPPRVIVDAAFLENKSSSIVDVQMLADRLRVELNRASNGRMVFVSRESALMVEVERELKRQKVVDPGTLPPAKVAGADYRLRGRITSLDGVDPSSGNKTRLHQIAYEAVDIRTGIIAWSNIYIFKKSSKDNIIYR